MVAADALSGWALSQAINSRPSFAGRSFLPTINSGVAVKSEIGSRSLRMSHDTGYIAPAPTWLVQLPMLIVYPSGGDWIARVTPMLAPAPVIFSTTMVWPSVLRMLSARRRASVSVGPPAENGTMMVMGRDGYCSANAGPISPNTTATAAAAASLRMAFPFRTFLETAMVVRPDCGGQR